MKQFRFTGLILIIVPLLFNIAFFLLGSNFEYPDILRQPTDIILTRFTAGGDSLVALWYVFAVSALLAIPVALLLQNVFADDHPQLASASGVVGALSGLVQVMGLLRWVFVVPALAAAYADPAASVATQEAVAVVFRSYHQMFGVAIGEHLGYVFTGTWTILISIMMFRSARFHPLLAGMGIVSAVGIMIGLLEPAGVEFAGAVNAISYIVWSLWMIAAGVMLLVRTPRTR